MTDMKKIVAALALILCMATTLSTKAQAWERNSKVLSIGFGGANFIHFDPNGYYGPRYGYSRLTGQFTFQGEFGIHKYVGLGFTTGVGGGTGWYGYYPELNVPIGFIANFHFYQLIEDKTSRDIHGDKLDIYAGLNVGSGFAVVYDRGPGPRPRATFITPLFFVGPTVGLRYYFVPKVGLNAEFGYGKTLAQIGFSFKL
jgi:hypothetical protein